MEMVSSYGLIRESMWVSTWRTRRRVSESSIGPMVDSTRGSGRMANSTAEANIVIRLEFGAKASGLMEKNFVGYDISSILMFGKMDKESICRFLKRLNANLVDIISDMKKDF